MLNVLEPERHRSDPAIATIGTASSRLDPKDDSSSRVQARQHDPEPPKAKTDCLWCGRVFTPRMTGGSPQRFCSTGHRQAFWVAARRWTMRAVEAGLLNVDCLKVS